jgi:ubiquinone/menaquinone biosynthesis C-methylase UbiE
MGEWDKSSHPLFYDYYAEESESPKSRNRFVSIRQRLLGLIGSEKGSEGRLNVADIGCGAAAQGFVWGELGHCVYGIDINFPLVKLGHKRAVHAGYDVHFVVGSATEFPWADESMDICLLAELLEHIRDWEKCLRECARILKPAGVLFLSTTNKLCPLQDEFNLFLYSWYPYRLKQYFEKLAVTNKPEIVNFATYPAVNWFTPYSLRKELNKMGFACLDRFELIDSAKEKGARKHVVRVIQSWAIMRRLAHSCVRGTVIAAIKGEQVIK